MRLLAGIATLALLTACSHQDAATEAAAESAAQRGLGLVDASEYAQSWGSAA
jgi:hypothetical protein